MQADSICVHGDSPGAVADGRAPYDARLERGRRARSPRSSTDRGRATDEAAALRATSALLVELADLDEVLALYAALVDDPPAGVVDLVPAARTLLLRYRPGG